MNSTPQLVTTRMRPWGYDESVTFVPPIKVQGRKKALVHWILRHVVWPEGAGRWVEPFMGSGLVGFTARPERAFFADNNPHIIDLYSGLVAGSITPERLWVRLAAHGEGLAKNGKEHYEAVRAKFNVAPDPIDLIFLSRTCYNGLMRFSQEGTFNTPYGDRPGAMSVTALKRLVQIVRELAFMGSRYDWTFRGQDFSATLAEVEEGDFIYLDPPYLGLYSTYHRPWTEADEQTMAYMLKRSKARWLLSTWLRIGDKEGDKKNENLFKLWGDYRMEGYRHTYRIGPKPENRREVIEVLVANYEMPVHDAGERYEVHKGRL